MYTHTGVVIYTGEDTKIRQNVKRDEARVLKSSAMRMVDQGIIGMLSLQLFLCVVGGANAPPPPRLRRLSSRRPQRPAPPTITTD